MPDQFWRLMAAAVPARHATAELSAPASLVCSIGQREGCQQLDYTVVGGLVGAARLGWPADVLANRAGQLVAPPTAN